LPTYLGVLLAPALLLSGFGLATVLRQSATAERIAGYCIAAIALMQVGASAHLALTRGESDTAALELVAARISAAQPGPGDRLFVTEASAQSVWLYGMTGLSPATPFLIPSQSMCDFPNAGPRRIAESFAAQPRFVVIAADPPPCDCKVEGVDELIRTALAQEYRRIDTVGRGDETYSIYERLAGAI
jgi:hypothetical protein